MTPNAITLILIGLRTAAMALSVAGSQKIGQSIAELADLYEAGIATDEHMRLVADKLKDRHATEADFVDVLARIKAHRAEAHT